MRIRQTGCCRIGFQCLGGDGEWWDLVYWESLAADEAAGEKFGAEMLPLCAPLVAPGSVTVSRSKAHVMQRG